MIRYNSQLSTKLNRRAVIKRLSESPVKDELGQYPAVESVVATVWCGVTPQTGSMLNGRQADTQLTRTTHKVTIRYREDIKDDMWLEIQGIRYDILYIVNPYLDRETLEIFCEVKSYGS